MKLLTKLLLFFSFLFALQENCSVSFAQNITYEKNRKDFTLTYNGDEPKIPSYEYLNSWFITTKTKAFVIGFGKGSNYFFKLKPSTQIMIVRFTVLDKNKKKVFSEIIDNKPTSSIAVYSQITELYQIKIDNLYNLPVEIMIFHPY